MPPRSLLKTWLWMAEEAKDDVIRKLGRDNLLKFFNDIPQARAYVYE